jgi:hypothetical protein
LAGIVLGAIHQIDAGLEVVLQGLAVALASRAGIDVACPRHFASFCIPQVSLFLFLSIFCCNIVLQPPELTPKLIYLLLVLINVALD